MQALIQRVSENASEVFNGLRINDLLDILILTILMYYLLGFLRKTSSGRVMQGLLVILLAMGASSVFELYAMSYLLNRVVEWGILALVVLFQPELRRMLERVGSGKLGLNGLIFSAASVDVPAVERAITQLVEAYTSLAKDKTGALVVFERRDLLDEMIKTGTPLDSGVSSELLKNIFWNKAPMHDGAVIVRDGRIVGAGCMLPLSGNVNLSRDLGMRHRAGIGMSEQSDAVVVIVSEETGSISVAVGGMLKRHLAADTLERLLRNELLEEDSEEKTNHIQRLSAFVGRRKKKEN